LVEPISIERVRSIIDGAKGAEIAVLGDVMLDRYFWGNVTRVSPEAPVPVVDIDNETFHLGGAANVASNLRSLGAKPLLFGVVGDDTSGKVLRSIAEQEGLNADGLVVDAVRPTTVKTRVIGNNQQIVRLDRETRSHVDDDVVAQVLKTLAQHPALKGIVLEDYDKGFLSNSLIESVIAFSRERNIPVFVDPKRTTLSVYRGCFLYKPNRKEAQDALGVSVSTDIDIRNAGAKLLAELQCDNVLITLGSAGMMLFESNGAVNSVPTVAKHVADVSGAGDTAIATIAAMVAGGATVREAAALANIASGVVVGEPGIVAITDAMLLDAVHDNALHRRDAS